MRTNHEFTTYLERHPSANRFSIDLQLKEILINKRRFRRRMIVIGKLMKRPGKFSVENLEEYQTLNDKLLEIKITEANLIHIKNML